MHIYYIHISINNICIQKNFDSFIGEETVSHSNFLPELTNAPTWIIDPIDGTTNFVHSFPHTCISIALAVNKELEIGIVYNPVLEQLFTARRGHGAFLNTKPIKSSNVEGKKFLSFVLDHFCFFFPSFRELSEI